MPTRFIIISERWLGSISIIQVIDAPCGAGKTSWAIQEINKHEDESYIYCTPFLSEVSRVKAETRHGRFVEPEYYIKDDQTGEFVNTSKIDCFESLLAANKDIAVSHSTFLNATPDTIQLISDGDYTLILDEALNAVEDFNNIQSVEADARQSMESDDIATLIEGNFIKIGEHGKVMWSGNRREYNSKFREVERLAKLGRLYLSRGKFLVTVFPPEMFSAFKKVHVLTYMLESEILQYYFELFGIEYTKCSIQKENDEYSLTPYSNAYDLQFRRSCNNLIHLCDKPKLIEPKRSLSKSWYEKNLRTGGITLLKKNLSSYFKTCVPTARASHFDVMWTCPKDYKGMLSIENYKYAGSITKEDREKKSAKELKELALKLDCFVPCNSRATNIYRERWALAYCSNLQRNPYIDGFFTSQGISVDVDAFKISSLIQWICRSRLRDGAPIELYIPSTQLRKMFIQWLDV